VADWACCQLRLRPNKHSETVAQDRYKRKPFIYKDIVKTKRDDDGQKKASCENIAGMETPKKHTVWNIFFLAIELAFIPLVLWWIPYQHLPRPGWAVAFIAGAAAAMSVHDKMKGWQKAIWLLVIGAFLMTELRAINKDRADSDAAALSDRQAQDLAFKGVRDSQDADFKATAGGLETAIGGIQSTLRAADTTLMQTRPHSTVRFDRFEFAGSPPKTIDTNDPYKFNYFYVNGGTETAVDLKVLARVYTGISESKEDQLKLARQFDEDWNKGNALETNSVLVPDHPSFGTIEKAFTDEEIKRLNLNGTVYFLIRFEYTDETGRWKTDSCMSFQRESPTIIDTNIAHPCFVFQHFRYAVKRQM
jgi:hypothetical protein